MTVRYKPPETDDSEFTAGEGSESDVSSYYAGSETDTDTDVEDKRIYKPAKTRAWELPEWSYMEHTKDNNVGFMPNVEVWDLQKEYTTGRKHIRLPYNCDDQVGQHLRGCWVQVAEANVRRCLG